jgi:ssDNA-binding Zn-finger/Zn-ribbon topoisomerase 1
VNASPPEEVVKEEVTEEVEQLPVEPPQVKEKQMGTCEACGKNMTLKNLKYSHKLICPALRHEVEVETEEEPEVVEPPPKPKGRKKVTPAPEEVPPKPTLRRCQSSFVPEEVPKTKKPTKRIEKNTSYETEVPYSTQKAEKYQHLASKALAW